MDLISGVSCKAPYVWVDKTELEWEFNAKGRGEAFHVSTRLIQLVLKLLKRTCSVIFYSYVPFYVH